MTNELIAFQSHIEVQLVKHCGDDEDICHAAWVSSGNDIDHPSLKKQTGLIDKLMADRHGSPFEEGYFSFYINAPRAVRDEHVRHRIGSYSSSSLRYRIADSVVYIPPPERPLQKAEGFKQIQPVYEVYAPEKYARYVKHLKRIYTFTAEAMEEMKDEGFTETEAVRWVTQDGLMTPYRARFNPRSLMHFLSLRTHEKDANHVSYPMWEIEQVARQIEAVFAEKLPITYAAWSAAGREAP